MNKKITVIMPVYNGEKYLNRCIDSILSQKDLSIDDIEILILNDGSSDRSKGIIDQYAELYPTSVRAVHQKNAGVAQTRNTGIGLASGEYIIFLDQDDWIEPDFCITFYKLIHYNSLDVVYGGYRRPDNKRAVRYSSQPPAGQYGKYIVMAAWAKIHRTSFLREDSIGFFVNRIGEDSPFTVKEISSTTRWMQTEYSGYNWFYNEESVSNTLQKELTPENAKALNRLVRKLIDVGDGSVYFRYFLLRTVTHYLLFSGRNTSQKNFIKCADELFTLIEKSFPDIYKTVNIFGPGAEATDARVAIAGMIFLRNTKLMPLFAKLYSKN